MIKNVGLVISEAEAALINSGKYIRTNGILRNAKTMEIIKHLPIIDIEKESCWKELGKAVSRVVKEKRPIVFVIAGAIVVTVTTIGTITFIKKRKAKKIEEQYNAWVNKTISDYVTKACKSELDVNTIAECENALKSLPQLTDKVFVTMTQSQVLEFTSNMKDYTKRLAEANNYEIEEDVSLDYMDNIIAFILKNLQMQRNILSAAA